MNVRFYLSFYGWRWPLMAFSRASKAVNGHNFLLWLCHQVLFFRFFCRGNMWLNVTRWWPSICNGGGPFYCVLSLEFVTFDKYDVMSLIHFLVWWIKGLLHIIHFPFILFIYFNLSYEWVRWLLAQLKGISPNNAIIVKFNIYFHNYLHELVSWYVETSYILGKLLI